MKKYLIKTVYVATESNEKYKSVVETYLSGKCGMSTLENGRLVEHFIKEFGYNRLCDAKRNLKSQLKYDESEMKLGHWNVKSEIVEYEIK